MKPTKKASEMTVEELAAYIDQSVLKPEFTQAEIRKYIQEELISDAAQFCINPSSLDIAAELCKGTKTKICVVCDFPFGLSTTTCKCMQAEEYCKRGDIFELDIVANYGWIRSGMWEAVEAEIRAVCDTCHKYGTAVKVIMETDALTKEEIIHATKVLTAAGADFCKKLHWLLYRPLRRCHRRGGFPDDGSCGRQGSGKRLRLYPYTRALLKANRYGHRPYGYRLSFHPVVLGLKK